MPEGGRITIAPRPPVAPAATAPGLAAGALCGAARCRDTGAGHGRGDAGARDGALLHHQGRRARAPGSACRWCMGWRSNRAARCSCAAARARAPRAELWLPRADAAPRRHAPAPRGGAGPGAPPPRRACWWWTTTRWSLASTAMMLEELGHARWSPESARRRWRCWRATPRGGPGADRPRDARDDGPASWPSGCGGSGRACRWCWRPAIAEASMPAPGCRG